MQTPTRLTINDHNRNSAGLTYVYPVLSRRAGGLSIGVNFNINNRCNWRCIYCQVPDLQRGTPPALNFELLEKELRQFLIDVLQSDFFDRFQVDEKNRHIKDIAISGNGEPTSVKDFDRAIELIGSIATELGVLPTSRFVLITNGSLIHRPQVQRGLTQLNRYGGEVWFKLDSATKAGRKLYNNAAQSIDSLSKNLQLSARLCPTKIQTCLVDYQHRGLTETEKTAYLQFLKSIKDAGTSLEQIMLYSLARPSMQPEAPSLRPLSVEAMQTLADELIALGFTVSITP